MEIEFVDKLPKPQSETQKEWEEIRAKLQGSPNKLAKVRTYNHPTNAYRDCKSINEGSHSSFPENKKGITWVAKVIRTDTSIIGPRSGKITFLHELYLVYLKDV